MDFSSTNDTATLEINTLQVILAIDHSLTDRSSKVLGTYKGPIHGRAVFANIDVRRADRLCMG